MKNNPQVTIAYQDLAAAMERAERSEARAERAADAIRDVRDALEGWKDAVKFGRMDLVDGFVSAVEDTINRIYEEEF